MPRACTVTRLGRPSGPTPPSARTSVSDPFSRADSASTPGRFRTRSMSSAGNGTPPRWTSRASLRPIARAMPSSTLAVALAMPQLIAVTSPAASATAATSRAVLPLRPAKLCRAKGQLACHVDRAM